MQVLGCVAVRHFARLMPLLLGWLQEEGVCGAAAGALETVALGCWPRMGAHAAFLQTHVRQVQRSANPACRVIAWAGP